MATRQVLAELLAAYEQQTGQRAAIEAVGGVDAAKRVQAGELDVVVLASDAIDKLIAAGAVVAGSRTDWVRSGVAVAVRAGAPLPDIGSEDAVRSAVLAARSISYSPARAAWRWRNCSRRWGIADQVAGRMVQAPPGVPVGSLVARGDVELGFQQLSELLHGGGHHHRGPAAACDPDHHHFFIGRRCLQPAAQAAKSAARLLRIASGGRSQQRQGMDPA